MSGTRAFDPLTRLITKRSPAFAGDLVEPHQARMLGRGIRHGEEKYGTGSVLSKQT